MPLQGAAAGCRCRAAAVLLEEAAAVRVVCALWSGHLVCRCRACLKVLLLEWCVRFGVGMLVLPLQGAAVGVVCALWSWPAGAAARCRCRAPVQGTAVRVRCAL